MKINYSFKNPVCYNANNGSISIHSIELSASEKNIYGLNYKIEWSDNISAEQKQSNLYVCNLVSGIYKFRVTGNKNNSDWTEVSLISPDPLRIISIQQDNNPCDNIASIIVSISGGTPPYRLYYGTNYKESSNNTIEINGLRQYKSDFIQIIDSENCSIISDKVVSTNFNHLFYEIKSIVHPIIYDDHPQECIISIKNSTGPHKFMIYESENNIKTKLISEINFGHLDYQVCNITKSLDYNLADKIYPGDYIIDIFDKDNCLYTTETITVPNIKPLEVNINYGNNNPIKQINTIPIELIFDTILIPYHLLINDNNLIQWIKTLDIGSAIVLTIGKKKYEQKIIKYKKDYTKDNSLNILQLGSSSENWYFSINIGRGLNIEDNIFAENIYININDQQYLINPGLDNSIDSFKLIRGNILTSSLDIHQFQNSDILYLYDTDRNIVAETEYKETYYTNNTYKAGLIFVINIIDNPNTIGIVDFTNPENYIFDYSYIKNMDNLKQTLDYLNDYNNTNVFVASKGANLSNGFFSLSIKGGVLIEHQGYDIIYYKYDTNTQKLYNIYLNNKITKSPILDALDPGTYIIKIKDATGNKLKYINTEPYDNHFAAVKSLIQESEQMQKLNFEYGDILINILDNDTYQILSNNNPNIPGLTTDNISKSEIHTLQKNPIVIPTIIGDYPDYNNQINIILLQNIKCTIVGPNNFSHTFSTNIQLKHLYPGVYSITGDDKELISSYLLNYTYNIYIGKNNQENIYIDFPSYKNKLIYKEQG